MTVRFDWQGDQVTNRMARAALKGLKDAGEFLLDESNKTVPFDEGVLQRSGKTQMDDEKLTVYISYDTPYAMRLHEHPNFRFKNGRRGKWLVKTLDEQSERINQFLKDKVRSLLIPPGQGGG